MGNQKIKLWGPTKVIFMAFTLSRSFYQSKLEPNVKKVELE